MTTKMRDGRQARAIHEAGHAVVAWLCGFDTYFVNIKPEGNRLGGVLLNLTHEQEDSFDSNDADMVRRRILVTCAGVMADMMHAKTAGEPPDTELYGWGSDREKTSDFMSKIREWGNVRLDKYDALAVTLLKGKHWDLVIQVADILVARDELTLTEIESFRAQCPTLSPEIIALGAATES